MPLPLPLCHCCSWPCPLGFEAGDEGVVLAFPLLAPLVDRVGVQFGRARGLSERLQRSRNVALQISVGVQVLIEHVAFELIFVDGDDLALGGAYMRRIPGHAAADEENEIGIRKVFIVSDS